MSTAAVAGNVFVAYDDDTFTCPEHTAETVDLASVDVETWQVGSDGWESTPHCRVCRKPISVVLLADVWLEPENGLLDPGWWISDDDGRRGPFATREQAVEA